MYCDLPLGFSVEGAVVVPPSQGKSLAKREPPASAPSSGARIRELEEDNARMRTAIKQFKHEVRFASGNKETIRNCAAECYRYEKELLPPPSIP